MKVGCVGGGWVGTATKKMFKDAVIYDPYIIDTTHPMWEYVSTTTKEDINSCDVTFIGVPTNSLPDGTLDTSIVEEVVSWCSSPLIVIRSTVNPGTTDYLALKYKRRLVMQPEYLGETPAHPNGDMARRNFIIVGGADVDTEEVVKLYTLVYNANVSIRQVSALEAEVIKLSENRAIGFKVMQCHELYLACKKAGLSYYRIRDAVYGDDWRFNLWFTFIYDNLGFETSKCLRKDIPAWCAWAESLGASTDLTKKLVLKSKEWHGKSGDTILEEYKTRNYRAENGVHS